MPMQTFLLVLFPVLGLAFGSFATVLIERLPKDESVLGHSRCSSCRRTLRPWELVPLLSFLFLRGACARCGAKILWEAPLLELTSALLFTFALPLASFSFPESLLLAFALWLLLVIAVIDARTQLIPDVLSFFLVGIGLALCLVRGSIDFLSPLVGLVFFGGQWVISKGRWVGSGDIILSLGIGVLLNDWWGMLVSLLASYILGAFIAVILLMTGRKSRSDVLPFGPFLVCGTYVALGFVRMGIL